MSRKCCDCQTPMIRVGKRGPIARRCKPCKQKAKHSSRMFLCCDCQQPIVGASSNGRPPKRCKECKREAERIRSASKPRTTYQRQCSHCHKQHSALRLKQRFCSPECSAAATKNRSVITCQNESCGKEFEVTQSGYANGVRCCSWECRSEHMKSPPQLCQNPACGCVIIRVAAGPKARAYGRDSLKYCSRSCYLDHRWGEDRPKKRSSKKALASASAGALQTSLRKKCKILGRPYDPECNRVAVCERDGWVCQMCGIDCLKQWTFDKVERKIDGRSAEHDHIIALATPGSPGNVFPNSQCLCHACNFKKRTAAHGQLRLDLEGSVQRWVEGGLARSQRRSRCSAEILAAGL
jgi:hypothetical protein